MRFVFKKVLFSFLLIFVPIFVFAQAKETAVFNINPDYDLKKRDKIEAVLVRTSPNLYFYIEKQWWLSLSDKEQNEVQLKLFELGQEFKNKIYPVLTSTFGSEPKPGIDGDEKITILFHEMIQNAGGYTNYSDFYSRFQANNSNEREMINLNTKYILSERLKSFLSHEFTHMISINQKNLLRNVSEDVWLEEVRAEYAPTLLGYDNNFSGSNLEARIKDFLDNPNFSLIEWKNLRYNYALANLFAQYLVDNYGIGILSETLRSSKVGIPSLEEYFSKKGINKKFEDVFEDWLITLLVNDCRLGEKYCYSNNNLTSLRVVPVVYFLPPNDSTFLTTYRTRYWTPNWYRFVGGGNNLSLKFINPDNIPFKISYLLCDKNYICSVNSFALNKNYEGEINFSNFSQNYTSISAILFAINKEGSKDNYKDISFSLEAKVSEDIKEDDLKSQLLARVSELQETVKKLQAQIAAILASKKENKDVLCGPFNNDLYFGLQNNEEVKCLQSFLFKEGVYPEGLITGNFFSLTRQAVIRFQEKYSEEILSPLGLKSGTGFVGQSTRAKINKLIGN
jgi:hypothetical protein